MCTACGTANEGTTLVHILAHLRKQRPQSVRQNGMLRGRASRSRQTTWSQNWCKAAHLQVSRFLVPLRHTPCHYHRNAVPFCLRDHRCHLALAGALHCTAVDQPQICSSSAIVIIHQYPARLSDNTHARRAVRVVSPLLHGAQMATRVEVQRSRLGTNS